MIRAVDLFAGLGGFSEGARLAGVSVVWAANHWRAAVDAHAANHGGAVHACQDLQQADFTSLPAHDWLLAAPSCTGHTRSRGKERPHHDAARATAWAVVSCAEACRPEVVVVENVPEMREWALYPAWRMAWGALGYSLTEHVVDAADFGVPQNRVRLFVVASRGFRPLRLRFEPKEQVPARAIVDYGEGPWSPVEEKAERTVARWRRGRQQHGERFLLPYYSAARGGRSLDRPVGTLTTVDRYGVVDGDRMRMLSVPEQLRAFGFRPDYCLPPTAKAATKALGNCIPPPLAQGVIEAVRAALR